VNFDLNKFEKWLRANRCESLLLDLSLELELELEFKNSVLQSFRIVLVIGGATQALAQS
jgi:hypothetical protein